MAHSDSQTGAQSMHRPDFPTDNIVSGNRYTGSSSDSDSESVFAVGVATEGQPVVARFLAKINPDLVRPALGPCWIWTGAQLGAPQPYGSFAGRKHGKPWPRYAHRLAWEWTHGAILDASLRVCHRCDVPLCVNPAHLFLGTQRDNLTDARQKGRLIDGLHSRTLSDDAYRDILSEPYTRGSGVALARKYGVTETSISRIRSGRQGVTYRRHQPLAHSRKAS